MNKAFIYGNDPIIELSHNTDKILDVLTFLKLINEAESLKEAKRINEALRSYLVMRAIPNEYIMHEKKWIKRLFE